MDLTFNVPNAGPLISVSLKVLSVRTATHLATGVYGWWKARGRTLSFIESISASEATLVGSTSFNPSLYRQKRSHGCVQGLVVDSGSLECAPGHVEATSVSNDVGVDCLRALTTGLLCLYDVGLTCTILADILPFGLLQPDQEDQLPEFTGPLRTSLTEFVTAVAAEEDCNTFRKILLHRAATCQTSLTGATTKEILQCDPLGDQELHLVLGVLRWMVLPRYKRTSCCYPTRSLKVWTTAVIMHELGFEISVSLECVKSTSEYARFVLDPDFPLNYQDVILVTASVGQTDSMLHGNPAQPMTIRPQLTAIGGLPYLALRRLEALDLSVDRERLVEIWQTSFQYAEKAVQLPMLSRKGMVTLNTTSEDTKVLREGHKRLSRLWSQHLGRILRPAMNDYVPGSLDVEDWSPENIQRYFDQREKGEEMFEGQEVRTNSYKLVAIILGTIYGACVKTLISVTSQASQQEFLEVALRPDLIYSPTVFRWAKILGQALEGILELYVWKDLIFELATGVAADRLLNAQFLTERLGSENDGMGFSSEEPAIFGVQANGIFAVSDFVVNPSCRIDNVLRFHVGTGRILNLPVDERGFLRSSGTKMLSRDLNTNPGNYIDVLRTQPVSHNPLRDGPLRFDAEPDWRENPRSILFNIRSGGVTVGWFNLTLLLSRLLESTVTCQCSKPQQTINVPRSEKWQIHTLARSLRPYPSWEGPTSTRLKDEDKIMIDVYGDEMHRLYAVGLVECRKMAICKTCIHCAYQSIRYRERKESAALIVN
ncbi:hypothetical protein MMC30_008080 [Trapelia coarctata]|nr:hypothetical protein [Trapelia coarctata]